MEKRSKKKDQDIEDILFSNNCFHMINWLESDTPSYNPNLNATYIPKIENETLRNIVTSHEYSHLLNSKNPKTCLLRIISRFIYYELNRKIYNDSCDISVLSLDQNPRLRMFKGFHDIIMESTKVVQEVNVLRDYVAPKSDSPIAKKLEKATLDKYKPQLPEFRRIYEMVSSLPRGCRIPLWYITTFPLDAPTKLPSILFDEKGMVNFIDITDEIAETALEEFQNNSNKLPFSPLKRLEAVLKTIKKLPGKGVQTSPRNFQKKFLKYGDFDKNDFPELDQEKTFTRKCNYCPIDFFHSRGIPIPYEDFGGVLPYYVNHPKYKMLNCDLERSIGEDKSSSSILNRVNLQINKNNTSSKNLSGRSNTEYQPVIRKLHFGYEANWPLTSFFVASEILKDLVFNPSETTNPPSHLTLIDRICFTGGIDFWDTPEQKVNCFRLSPFITVKTVNVGLREEGLDYELS